ncbi:hypothetical protein [Streptacidiphilus sp. P02-A3a]|uniref:hypothetical protein n=1 Tax=Streptacidiphilus sp. P02-A3a TaxID=2704468 RepID=UPI0015F864F8|nr:hypothetical protein [Streptacidiphilus sp. P02-A3a]QMU71136.1 hypothetical protein GXP74_25870 [Streptacidiphilus sp. P02-A3a]
MRPRAILAAAAVAAATVIVPVTAPAASAGTPGCGTSTITSATTTSIVITETPICAGESYASLWLNIPIANGWQGVGYWTTVPTTTSSGQLVYTCQGNAYNTFQLQQSSGGYGTATIFTDDCGPQEP